MGLRKRFAKWNDENHRRSAKYNAEHWKTQDWILIWFGIGLYVVFLIQLRNPLAATGGLAFSACSVVLYWIEGTLNRMGILEKFWYNYYSRKKRNKGEG